MESSEAGGDTLCRVNGILFYELSHGPTYLQSMVLEPKLRAPTRDPGVSILKVQLGRSSQAPKIAALNYPNLIETTRFEDLF